MPRYTLTAEQDISFGLTKNDGSSLQVDPIELGSTDTMGPYAARPAPGRRGAIYYATDSINGQWIDNGIAWQPLIGNVLGSQVPSKVIFDGTWTPFNTTAENTVTEANGSLIFQGDADPTLALRGWALPCSSSADVAIEVAIDDITLQPGGIGQFTIWGCGIRKASTQQAWVLSLARNDGIDYSVYFFDLTQWTNNATRGGVTSNRYSHPFDARSPTFIRVARTAGQFVASLSRDRQNWSVFSSIGAPFADADQLILGTDVIGTSVQPRFQLRHLDVDAA